MCGICGYTGRDIPSLMPAMIEAIRTRGPDGEGMFAHADVYLGHTRLAVIDPDNGAQPLASADGRYVVSYNGEIYNYAKLREELERLGVRFRTDCDTELIPAGYAVWGSDLFARLDGIFAFALLDTTSGQLTLVRDQLGVKPLYYAYASGVLVFGSTVRAVLTHPAVSSSLDMNAVRDVVQYRWIRSGKTMHEAVEVLPAATSLVFNGESMTRERYWTPGAAAPVPSGNEEELAEAVHTEIDAAVRAQLRADVPVSVFLSGGVDSSMIAQIAARHSPIPLTAFTINVGNQSDVDDAARLAASLGMPHRILQLEEVDFDCFPDVIGAMDRPVGDAVVLAAWKLCRDASKDVKVVLTGDGADEIFAGYVHMPVLRKLDRLKRLSPLMRAVAPVIGRVPVSGLDRLFHYEASLGRMGRDAVVALLRAVGDPAALMARATQVVPDAELEQATTFGPAPVRPAELSLAGLRDDMRDGWLSEQILPKLDQLSMAHGLEARVPYVTPRLVDMLYTISEESLLAGGENKRLLRRAAIREGVAAARTGKRAFHVPMETRWRRPMKRLIDEWLSESVTRKHGVFRMPYVERLERRFDEGEFLASKTLVNMAALHMWMDRNV
ncbi:MAG: asparagine synthase (glutamine-hydrolyzing) [Rhodospirillales bacterium]